MNGARGGCEVSMGPLSAAPPQGTVLFPPWWVLVIHATAPAAPPGSSSPLRLWLRHGAQHSEVSGKRKKGGEGGKKEKRRKDERKDRGAGRKEGIKLTQLNENGLSQKTP